jgi:hypothetical protein
MEEIDLHRIASGADSNREELMLVGIAEVVHDSQRIVPSDIAPICVVVRLNPLDDGFGASGHPLYYSGLHGRLEFIRGEANGKLDLEIRRSMACENKRPDEVIQAGAKMVNNLTSQHREAQWNGLPTRVKGASLCLMIEMTNDYIVVRVDKRSDLSVEVLDILVGPLNLRPAAVEKV